MSDTADTQALRQILEVTRKLAAPFDLDTMLAEVVDASREVLNADRGTVFLVSDDLRQDMDALFAAMAKLDDAP